MSDVESYQIAIKITITIAVEHLAESLTLPGGAHGFLPSMSN